MKKWLKWLLWIVGILIFLLVTLYFLSFYLNYKSPEPTNILEMYCGEDVYNCDSYSSQEDAQQVYDFCMEDVGYDVHGLDNDGDGVVCEGLN